MATLTPEVEKAIFTGFRADFNQGFQTAQSYLERLATVVNSSGRDETYAWLGAIPMLREWIGERQAKDLELHDYSLKNVTFESTVKVKREDIEDDRAGVYSPLIRLMGEMAKKHPDKLLFELIREGQTRLCYDKKPFFSTEHPMKEGTASNLDDGSGSAWYLLDTSKSLKPFIFQKRRDYSIVSKTALSDDDVFYKNEHVYGVDGRVSAGYGLWQFAYCSQQPLTHENYARIRSAMRSLKAENGMPLDAVPDLLVVPPALEESALHVVKAELLENGRSNIYAGTAEAMVSPWL